MAFKFRNDYKFTESRENELNKVQIIDKTDLVGLQSELSNKTLELQELQAELLAVKQFVDLKDQALSKAKEDLKQVQVSNNKAVGEQRFLQEEILNLQREQEKTLEDYEKVLDKVQVLTSDINEKTRIIDILENKNKLLESQLSEARAHLLQLEIELQESRNRESEALHEAKVVKNQISVFQEEEDNLLRENKQLKSISEEFSCKFDEARRELDKLLGDNIEKERAIKGFKEELQDYDDILGDFKGYREENKREREEKERGVRKIREMILKLEEKDKTVEQKDREIRDLHVALEQKDKKCDEILVLLQDEKRNVENKEKKIKELANKVELLEFKQSEVKDYLARKGDRMRVRYEAQLALAHSLKLPV